MLFDAGEKSVFAVLDGASVPDLVKSLYEHEPEYCCLYRGELEPDIATVAPYLVRLEPEDKFSERVLTEGWGVHWGIFVHTQTTLRALRITFANSIPSSFRINARFFSATTTLECCGRFCRFATRLS